MDSTTLKFPKPKKYKFGVCTLPFYVEEKMDGVRMTIWKGHAYGRRENSLGQMENKWYKLPTHIQCQAQNIPIDGEVIWPGKDATDVATGLAEQREELQFVGFQLPTHRLLPHEHIYEVQSRHVSTPRIFTPEECLEFNAWDSYWKDEENVEQRLIQHAKKLRLEGFILKERCRAPFWYKLKVSETYDLIVSGLEWPTAGKYKTRGWIKSLECAAYVNGKLRVVANVSGMTDEVRSKIDSRDIGRIVEVEANLFASQGRLKHPRFIRWRADKNEKECVIKT